MYFVSRTHSTQKINLTWEVYLHSVCPSDLVMANSRLQAALGQPICPPLLTQHTSLCKDYLFVLFPVLVKQPCQKSQATGWHVLSGRMLPYLYHCFTFPTSIPKHSGELISHAHMKGLIYISEMSVWRKRKSFGTHQVTVVWTAADSALDLCSKPRQIP